MYCSEYSNFVECTMNQFICMKLYRYLSDALKNTGNLGSVVPRVDSTIHRKMAIQWIIIAIQNLLRYPPDNDLSGG